jgi:hypothetical protein
MDYFVMRLTSHYLTSLLLLAASHPPRPVGLGVLMFDGFGVIVLFDDSWFLRGRKWVPQGQSRLSEVGELCIH